VLSLSSEESKTPSQKRDVKQLVMVIPPASEVLSKGVKQVKEKRIRVRLKSDVSPDELRINPRLAKELNIKESIELSIAGRKKLVFKATILEGIPEGEVWANEEFMKEKGVADNSMATVRAA